MVTVSKREYGDGLEKYEPNDINKALAPDFSLLSQNKLKRLAELQISFLNTEKGPSDEETILGEANTIFDALI
jgi:adenine-specific DNA-methyltransferase